MKAIFGSKMMNLETLTSTTRKARMDGWIGNEYQITREVILSDKEYEEFTNDFTIDQPWITSQDGGGDNQGVRCLRVTTKKNRKGILVNNEGYTYPRYVALES